MRKSKRPQTDSLPDPGPMLPPPPNAGREEAKVLVQCIGYVTATQMETLKIIFDNDAIRILASEGLKS